MPLRLTLPAPHLPFLCRLHTAPPIDAQLRGPASLAHDFGASPLCVVPVSLLLRNTMAAAAAVCIEVGRQPDGQALPLGVPTWAPSPPTASADGSPAASSAASTSAAAGALPPVRQYAWCGRTRLTLPALSAGQVVEVPLRVAITRPGKVALADCLVSWHFAGPPNITGSRVAPAHHCSVQQQ